jgi:YtkA-like
MRKVSLFIIIASLVFAVGCAKSVTQSTADGKFHVKMIFSDKTLKIGRNAVELKITDEKGAAVERAKLDVIPTMPEHHMGAMFPPTVTEEGGGNYKVVMPLTMAGHWAVEIRIAGGGNEGTTTFDFPNIKK